MWKNFPPKVKFSLIVTQATININPSKVITLLLKL